MVTETTSLKSKRVEWVDVAKGLGILFVVFGHSGIPDIVVKWVWSFHMPFFFFISGLLFSPKRHTAILAFIRAKANSLLKPYIIFTLLVIPLFWWLRPELFPDRVKIILLSGWGSLALWFVPVLFMAELLFFVVFRYLSKKYYLIILFLCSLAGLYLSREGLAFPYKMEAVLNAVLFYGFGQFISSALKTNVQKLSQASIIGFIAGALALNLLFCFLNDTRTDMAANQMGQYHYYLLAAMAGTLFLVFASVFIEKTRFEFPTTILKYLGKNTYVILAFHQIIMMCLIKLFSQLSMPGVVSTLIRQVIMWSLLILLINFVNAKVPFVLGHHTGRKVA